jgi:hypothetical protein
MKTIFGGLIEFKDENEFNAFFSEITQENALKIIEMALLYGAKSGLYDLSEAHAIYNSLEKIKEKNG